MSKYDLISIGDATMDAFVTPTETETLCTVDRKECYVAFSYGDKIPVRYMEFSVGGNAANNAVGARRLGVNVGIVLTIGDDDIGKNVREHLAHEGVDTTYVITQPATGSNYSTIINYGGERTIFSYHAPRSYEWPVNLPAAPWVYLTSMGESFEPFYKHVVEWVIKNPGIKLAFNPGSRQLRVPVEQLSNVMKLTYMVYVNRKEAEKLTGTVGTEGKEKDLLVALSKLGPRVCIITDGANGSYVYDGQRFVRAGVFPVDAYERTGAGDAFGSGCISALVKGKSLEEALLWGTLNSASVIGYVGSQKGLLAEESMNEWLVRARNAGVSAGEF